MTCAECKHWQRPKRKRIHPYEFFKCDQLTTATIHVQSATAHSCNECDPYGMDTLTLETPPTFGCCLFEARASSPPQGPQGDGQ